MRRSVAAGFLQNGMDEGRPPHVGVLLDNMPEYIFWLAGAAISGCVVVGINSTYRGDQLAQLVASRIVRFVVTSSEKRPLLDGLELGLGEDRIIEVDAPDTRGMLPPRPVVSSPRSVAEDLFLLIFTSGSTGMPKAVRCTQGRFARTGVHVATVTQLSPETSCTPLCRSSTRARCSPGGPRRWRPASPSPSGPRFSASRTLTDVRRFSAT